MSSDSADHPAETRAGSPVGSPVESPVESPAESLADLEVLGDRVARRLAEFVAEQAGGLEELGPHLTSLLAAANDAVRGGKRLRAAFCYWGWRAAQAPAGGRGSGGRGSGGRGAGGGAGERDDGSATAAGAGEPIVAAAAAIELVHASALVHDDVMDGSDTRRGRPAAHRQFEQLHRIGSWQGATERFGTGAAILLGDLLLSWSGQLLRASGFDDDRLMRALAYFDALRTEVTAGQYLDLVAQHSGRSSVPQAMRVVRYKSAKYTVERPLHLGAALAGADEPLLTALTSYGLPLGEAFQLRDDLLGVFGDPEVTGKPAGDDLREGKRTVLLALADERATEEQAQTIARLLGDQRLDDRGVALLRETIEATGARAAVEELIATLTSASTTALQQAPIADAEVTAALRGLAAAATHRTR